jgi:hypothetical protein
MDDLVSLCRFIVALAFLSSAAWKVAHPGHFSAVLAGGPPASRALARTGPAASLVFAAVEMALALTLVLVRPHWLPAAVTVAFLAAFSAFLIRADSLANGCGCWRPPQAGAPRAAPYVLRNSLLAALAAGGGIGSGTLSPGPAVTLGALAILPALLVMELPTIAELAWPIRSRPYGGPDHGQSVLD